MSNTNTITPKPCSYNCGTRIYWNTAENAYFEVFNQKRHICPNRQQQSQSKPIISTTTAATRPNYYNKFAKQPKPKLSNSLELLSGSISEVQKQYENLSNIVSEFNGTTHGSQSHISTTNNKELSIVVYFGVAEGRLNEFKQKYNNQQIVNTRQQNYR